jgi:hypothetical protein
MPLDLNRRPAALSDQLILKLLCRDHARRVEEKRQRELPPTDRHPIPPEARVVPIRHLRK